MSEPDQVGDQVFEARNGLYDDISLIAQDALYQANVDADFGPGHWISHGPLFIGRYGYPDLHLSRLTSGEQMTQMSLWSLFSAPLVVSCDLNHLDPNLFNHATSSILMNDEVLAVDQDPDAKPPVVISNGYGRSVWMKPLSDGRTAVAFVNTTNGPNWGEVKWADINLSGTQPIRDLWNHQDLAPATGQFDSLVPPESVMLIAIGKASTSTGQ
jgi:alpha-galactosidase